MNHSRLETVATEVDELKRIITRQQIEIKEQNTKIDVLTESLVEQDQRIDRLMRAGATRKLRDSF